MNTNENPIKKSPAMTLLVLLITVLITSPLFACTVKNEEGALQDSKHLSGEEREIEPETIPQETEGIEGEEIKEAESEPSDSEEPGHETEENEKTMEESAVPKLKMMIDGQELSVLWENNESVKALFDLATESRVTVHMSMYGGFEQVGSLGTSIVRNDVQTVTQAGDIVLYSGNQIVVFYGSNSWAYTRLGRIEGLNESELTDLLGREDVELTLFIE